MKKYVFKIGSMFIIALLASTGIRAQFDDIYFDPDADEYYVDSYSEEGDTYVTENYYYDDDDYDYYDEYDQDFYYSSRIRRFNRPFQASFGFYDPFFYDPFYYGSGLYLSFGNPYRSWNRWNRWNRFNNFGFYDPFFSPYAYGGFGWFDSYFGYCPPSFYSRSFGYGGLYNSYYVNNYYGSAYDYYQPVYSNNSRGYQYGARRGGSVKASPTTPVGSPRTSSRTFTTTDGNSVRNTTAVRTTDNQRDAVVGGKTYRNPDSQTATRRITKTYTPTRTNNTQDRSVYGASPNSSNRAVSPSSSARRSYSPSSSNTRSYSPGSSSQSPTRSYSPSRSGSSSRSYTPSRSYSPSRSSSPSRSYSPSRSSSPSRSYSPSSSGSSRSYSPSSSGSSSRSSGSSSGSSRSSSPRRN